MILQISNVQSWTDPILHQNPIEAVCWDSATVTQDVILQTATQIPYYHE